MDGRVISAFTRVFRRAMPGQDAERPTVGGRSNRVARQTPRAPASRRARGGAALAALHHRAHRRREASAAVLFLDPLRCRGAPRPMVPPGPNLGTPVDPPPPI